MIVRQYMRRVAQSMKDGHIVVLDVPVPALRPQGAPVCTTWSRSSAGTEGAKVGLGRNSQVAKACSRPDQVKHLLSPKRVAARGPFGAAAFRGIIEDGRHGRVDNAYRIWALLALEVWHQVFVDGPRPAVRHG